MRTGERDQLVVSVDWLRLLVGPDRDGRQGGDEESRIEHAFHHWEDVGVHRDLLEGRTVHEEVVDAPRVKALEQVVGGDGPELPLESEKGAVDLVDELGLYGVGQHRVAVLGDALEVGLEVGEGTHGRVARLGASGIRSLAWSHGRNSMDEPATCLRTPFAFLHVGCRIDPVVESVARAVGAVGSALA